MKLFKVGKVKEVYESETEPDILEFQFTDKISVFDKVIPSTIPHKGESLCRTSTYWFEEAKKLGYNTHFIERPAPDRMKVRRVSIISDYDKITTSTTNYLIPLEFICRYYLAGSLYNRVKKGKVKLESLGFKRGSELTYGMPLPEPHFEMTTKLEETDRLLSDEEAIKIAGLTQDDYRDIREMVFNIDAKLNEQVLKRNLIHVDGKKEFAFNESRELMLIDTFGTADEDRFWDAERYEEGEHIELSKEYVRQYYHKTGYYDELESARAEGSAEPDIPPLPETEIGKVSSLYIDLFERITGEKFK
ncbi:MAG: phosphoribosylaminoimidazolesuccinocarboxamide synthase [Thermoplasmata archaeon]|nr:MAG: phosphoribosylaminoimidazolesuccinocarboxamide synthase [Thermoplasmata archaeon]